jgi:hypothetical protein
MATFSLDSALNGVSNAIGTLNGSNPLTQSNLASFESNGFLVASTPSADGNGLPFTKIPSTITGQLSRNIITWFVPQFGTVRMFINPQNISYIHKKLITKERTKGGYTLQYWGEDLSQLTINGTTGSSGIEGINMLYEIYRAEQYAFDAVGLTLAANNASADVANNLVQGIGGALGQLIGGQSTTSAAGGAGLLGGILGLDSPNNNLSARNLPSLASLAFAVEMYYNGWVYRGYFENMTINERADNFLLDYSMTFTVTEKRGYRTNYFPWSNSPVPGPTSVQAFYPNINSSFNGEAQLNTNQSIGSVANPGSSGGIVGALAGLL